MHEHIKLWRWFLFSQLEGDKRKSAIKLNSSQKRKAIVDLFKCLKNQGIHFVSVESCYYCPVSFSK